MKHCGYCGKEIVDEAKFCPYCSKPVKSSVMPNINNTTICKQCGRTVKAGARFCPYCSAQMGQNQVTYRRRCSQCGRLLNNDVKICHCCATPIASGITTYPKSSIKRSWIIAVVAALVICIGIGGFYAYENRVIERLINPSAKYHTVENGFISANGEIAYASPTDESHLKPAIESNDAFLYADNELIIQLTHPMTESEARKFAHENNAELVGFISGSGTCQWRLEKSFDKSELLTIMVSLCEKKEIQQAGLNFLLGNNAGVSSLKDERIWMESDGSWGYFDVHANDVYDNYRSKMINPISVGIYDAGFQEHYDINYTFYNDTGLSLSDCQHGTHVTGIAMANSNNQVGIRGVYPNPDGRALIKTGVAKNKTEMQDLSTIAGMIFSGCKVINVSMWLSDFGVMWYCLDQNIAELIDKEYEDVINYEIDIYRCFLKNLIDKGHQFLIVQIAGNGAKRNGNAYFWDSNESKMYDINDSTKLGNREGIKITGNYPSTYNSFFAAIKDDAIRRRIIIVGGYDEEHNILSYSNMDERVDIMAPGNNIYSTAESLITALGSSTTGIMRMDGTSMAAPFVTGAVACIWAMDESLTADEVRSLLLVEWPETGPISIAEGIVRNNNEIITITDHGYSNSEALALNLKASMELTELYIKQKRDTQDVKGSYQTKIIICDGIRILDDCEITITSDDGRDYEILNNSQQADFFVYDQTERAYYVSLPIGYYTVSIAKNEHMSVYTDMDPTKNYNANSSENYESITIWRFDWKQSKESPQMISVATEAPNIPTPTTETKLSTVGPNNSVNNTWLFHTKIAELVTKYGVISTNPQVKTVGNNSYQYLWNNNETQGLLFADILDYDEDGVPELLTLRNTPLHVPHTNQSGDDLILELYEAEGNSCRLADSKTVRLEALSMSDIGTSVSVFRYANTGHPAIGVLCETDSGNDWVQAVLSYEYSGDKLSLSGGAFYGEWPGSYASYEGEEGYLSACFEAISEESALYTSANGDTFEKWRLIANSGWNYADPEVVRIYKDSLAKIGLAVRDGSSLAELFSKSGRHGGTYDTEDPNQGYHIRYRHAADALSAISGKLTELGIMTSEYFYDAKLKFATDYFYRDMQEFIATDCLGSLDAYRTNGQTVTSETNNEDALRQRVMEAYAGTGSILAWGYTDYDGDGKQEAFALIGVYDDDNWENSAELWFVNDTYIDRLEFNKGYYPYESDVQITDNRTCFKVSEGYFGSGTIVRFWTVVNGEPVLYSESQFTSRGEESRQVFLPAS